MNIKHIGMDVHKETISIAVTNGEGKLVMESIIETKARQLWTYRGLALDPIRAALLMALDFNSSLIVMVTTLSARGA